MELKVGVTLQYFVWSLSAGVFMAFLYDFLRSSRRLLKTSVFGVNLEDVLFFCISAIIIFWVAFDKNNGVIRLQGFAGVLIGFLIYRMVFKDFFVRVMVFSVEIFVKVFVWFLRVILFPMKVIYRILAKPFLVIGWYSRQGVHKAENIMKIIKKRRWIRKKAKQST